MSAAVTARRAVVGGTAAVCLVLAGGSGAWAHGKPGGDGWEKKNAGTYQAQGSVPAQDKSGDCEFSLNGETWASAVKVDDQNLKPATDGKVHVQVRAAREGATCTVSLASYRTHGATWNTSGLQVFHDFDTVTVKGGETGTLDISVPDAGCFAQVDLYRGSVKYDGLREANDGFEHGDLPEGPNKPVIKEKNISWWNGGTRDCSAQTTPPVTPPATTEPAPETTSPSAPATTPATSISPSDEVTTPGETPTETPSSSESPSSSVSPSPSVTPDASDSPSSSPTAVAPGSDDDLAETGGGNVTVIAGVAAALLALGGGLVFLRRRNAGGNA